MIKDSNGCEVFPGLYFMKISVHDEQASREGTLIEIFRLKSELYWRYRGEASCYKVKDMMKVKDLELMRIGPLTG